MAPALLPLPRQLTPAAGSYSPQAGHHIALAGQRPAALLAGARRLQRALREHAGVECPLVAVRAADGAPGIVLEIAPDAIAHPQGYQLIISPTGVRALAREPAGVFYAVCTLVQLVEQVGAGIPCLRIDDWPDFAARGVMLDISRDKVPRFDTLLALVDMLAGWKVNQVQLYTEHTFAYRHHPEVWAGASPLTGQEILELDAFCRERFVELVPNQNAFGHMERWFEHPRYRALAELRDGAPPLPGTAPGIWPLAPLPYGQTLCPGDPGSLALVRSLLDELLPHFTSTTVNVGCDETFDLEPVLPELFYTPRGRSQATIAARGAGRVYLDFLRQIHGEVTRRGHTMQFWGDIVARHPELVPELPRDAVALEWGYDADHPFEERGARFAAAGLPFYVCPGTSSWGSIAGRTDEAIGNLRNAAAAGRQHGASGYLNTDWGEDGHRQVLPISFLGFAVGAAAAWADEANRALDVPGALDRHAFRDRAGVLGRVASDLGNVARATGVAIRNGTLLGRIMRYTLDQLRAGQLPLRGASFPGPEAFRRTLAAIDEAAAPLAQARLDRPDADLIAREYALTVRLLRHACRRALLLTGGTTADYRALAEDLAEVIEEYRSVWLARNRPGGLEDSVARLAYLRDEYRAAG